MEEERHLSQRKLKAASFSVVVNISLTALKVAVFFISGSIAILAEVLHSGFDLLASGLAYAGIKKAGEPADEGHQYGHEKYENLSSLAQTMLIAATSALVIYEAIDRLLHPVEVKETEVGLAVMAISLAAAYAVSRYLHKASRKYQSSALEADAYHFTTDVWSILAVMAGLVFVQLGYKAFDSLAAIVVAALMLWVTYQLGTKAVHALMDRSPPSEVEHKIGGIIRGIKGVKSYHKMRARVAGNRLLVEVHIQVSPSITVRQGHDIAHNAKAAILEDVEEVKDVTIHVEPFDP
jgi:cation diffusion facilitator family transporter